jgi:hypothetical protein
MASFDKTLFFEKEYEKELKVKDSINNNLTSTLTLLIINLTIFSYFIINTPILTFLNSEHKVAFIIFFVLIWCYLIYFVCMSMDIYNFYFSNNLYMKIPYANQLDEHFNSLKEFDESNFNNNVNNYLLSFYISATSYNSEINEYKNNLLFRVRRFLFLMFLLLSLVFISYYVIMNGNLNTYNVKLVK